MFRRIYNVTENIPIFIWLMSRQSQSVDWDLFPEGKFEKVYIVFRYYQRKYWISDMFRTLSNRAFCENSYRLLAVNYFCKTLLLRCLTDFWMRSWNDNSIKVNSFNRENNNWIIFSKKKWRTLNNWLKPSSVNKKALPCCLGVCFSVLKICFSQSHPRTICVIPWKAGMTKAYCVKTACLTLFTFPKKRLYNGCFAKNFVNFFRTACFLHFLIPSILVFLGNNLFTRSKFQYN